MLYENVFILRQDLTPKAAVAVADKYAQFLEKHGAKLAQREDWGLLELAYRVHKNKRGYFFLFHIDGSASSIQAWEAEMRLDEDALRYLTLRVDKHDETPSVMMRYLQRLRETEGKGAITADDNREKT